MGGSSRSDGGARAYAATAPLPPGITLTIETGDVIVKICTDPLPVASEHASGLPRSVDAFFERALALQLEEASPWPTLATDRAQP